MKIKEIVKNTITNRETRDIVKENKEEIKECEKCGEECGTLAVGDETYDYCKNYNWVTH